MEVNKYFSSDEARKCTPTAYAEAQGAHTSDRFTTASGEATCWWRLRSPDRDQSHAASVRVDGSVCYCGDYVNLGGGAVRPALWINSAEQIETCRAAETDPSASTPKPENIAPAPKAENTVSVPPSGKTRQKVKVGDVVKFGKYEQGNGKEAIEWQVLAVEGSKALLISKYALDCQQYNMVFESVTWETCTLRKWLNDTFYNGAFSTAEKARILPTKVTADRNPKFSTTPPGNPTSDKVFLLSTAEANKYFSMDGARRCAPTAYAKAQGANTSSNYTMASGEATCWWWLRSPGEFQFCATIVRCDGSVRSRGYYVNVGGATVRPALWIHLES